MSNQKTGFILAFSVLISSLVLSIGLGMFNITLKELILSSSSRESQLAFYAADTGGECALYWDIKGGTFATSTILGASGILCLESDITTNTIDSSPNSWIVSITDTTSYAKFRVNFTNGACAEVTVNKDFTAPQTTIESRGYNTCDLTDIRRVERGLIVTY